MSYLHSTNTFLRSIRCLSLQIDIELILEIIKQYVYLVLLTDNRIEDYDYYTEISPRIAPYAIEKNIHNPRQIDYPPVD